MKLLKLLVPLVCVAAVILSPLASGADSQSTGAAKFKDA